jgi:predicted alpha/beta superfamily hydrolase
MFLLRFIAGRATRRGACLLWAAALCAWPAAHAQPAPTVSFVIDLRAEIAAGRFDPARDGVGVRGALPPLAWSRTLPAAPRGDGRYELEVTFVPSPRLAQPIAYKFKIERAANPDAGWEPGRNHALLLQGRPLLVERAFGDAPPAPALQRTGTIERHPGFASRHVQARDVQVWLPPGYAGAGAAHYPVLYLHDGQNVFDDEAAGAEWQVDETAQRLVGAGQVAPMIVVAVSSTATRLLDYTAVPVRRDGVPVGGGAAAYARFLVDELKPFIDRRYRTRREAAHTAVGGSSVGALLSIWLLLHHGPTFGAALVVSPAVWWGGGHILHELSQRALPPNRPRVWLDIGLLEGDEALRGARQLRDALLARGWLTTAPAGAARPTLAYVEDANGTHDEASWAGRVEPMLRFLYPTDVK